MPTREDTGARGGTRVCILGESPLVEEYATLCLARGFDVRVRVNPSPGSRGTTGKSVFPKGTKKVARPPRATDIGLELTNIRADAKKKNLVELDRVLDPDAIIISSSTTIPAGEQARWISGKARLLGIGALPSLLSGELVELAPASMTDKRTKERAEEFIGALGKQTAFVADTVGLIFPRILCMLANEACFALEEKVASPGDIDLAIKLGAQLPTGLLEWAQRVGFRHVHAVMCALRKHVDEKHFRVAPLLERAATRGLAVIPVRD